MKISVVTPAFRANQWLKLCIPSVADQEGVEVEHIVQDACSDDGTQEWLPGDSRVIACIEKDNGMYDAINRGWKRATGDIVCHLNSDEQYLPGALKAVHDYFEANPQVDILLADTVITDADGNYLCHRIGLKPIPHLIRLRMNSLTCSVFIRRRVLTEHQLYFDTSWRDLGDMAWMVEACHRGLIFGEMRRKVAIFADTGENMNLGANSQQEHQRMADSNPFWLNLLSPAARWFQRLRLIAAGGLDKTPFEYALYLKESPDRRVVRQVPRPTTVWVGRTSFPVKI